MIHIGRVISITRQRCIRIQNIYVYIYTCIHVRAHVLCVPRPRHVISSDPFLSGPFFPRGTCLPPRGSGRGDPLAFVLCVSETEKQGAVSRKRTPPLKVVRDKVCCSVSVSLSLQIEHFALCLNYHLVHRSDFSLNIYIYITHRLLAIPFA